MNPIGYRYFFTLPLSFISNPLIKWWIEKGKKMLMQKFTYELNKIIKLKLCIKVLNSDPNNKWK